MATLPVEPYSPALSEAPMEGPTPASKGASTGQPARVGRGARVAKHRGLQVEDQLAEVRRRKAHERTVVARYVDQRLGAMECEEVYTVPVLYVAVTGSLAPAHLLSLVARWSERACAATGSGWVRRDVQTWVNFSGLAEEDWILAREALRIRGLIEERRRYDAAAREIVTEIAFVPSVFAEAVAMVRDALRDDATARLRDGQLL